MEENMKRILFILGLLVLSAPSFHLCHYLEFSPLPSKDVSLVAAWRIVTFTAQQLEDTVNYTTK